MKHNCERTIFENTLFWKSDILTSRFLTLGLERGEKKMEQEQGLTLDSFKTNKQTKTSCLFQRRIIHSSHANYNVQLYFLPLSVRPP